MNQSLLDGLTDFYSQQAAPAPESSSLVGWRKLKSVALAVHPSQVGEAAQDAEARGVPTSFTADGCPVFESRTHRKRYMQAYGYFDRDAGYGDAAPRLHKGEKAPPSRLRELAHRLAERVRAQHMRR